MVPTPAPDGWLRVAAVRDLGPGTRLRVVRGDLDLVLVRCDGEFYACDNTCAHQHFAELHNGTLSGCLLTCPMHGWTFDVRTGISTTGEGRIATYRVAVRGEDIYVAVP